MEHFLPTYLLSKVICDRNITKSSQKLVISSLSCNSILNSNKDGGKGVDDIYAGYITQTSPYY